MTPIQPHRQEHPPIREHARSMKTAPQVRSGGSLLAAASVAVAFLVWACVSAPLSAASADSTRLLIGTTANFPPVVYRQDDAIVGIEPDFAEALGQELGRDVAFVDMPWDQLFEALDSGRVDMIMAGVSITEDREERVAFVQPYLEVGQMVLIRDADLGRLSAPDAIAAPGRVVGVEKGTTGHLYVERTYPDASLVSFSSAEEGVAALRRGEIEYFVHDAPTIWTLTLGADALTGPDLIALYILLTRERLAWAVEKGNVQLLNALNGALLAMQQDGRAQHILDKWIPGSVTVTSPVPPVEF